LGGGVHRVIQRLGWLAFDVNQPAGDIRRIAGRGMTVMDGPLPIAGLEGATEG